MKRIDLLMLAFVICGFLPTSLAQTAKTASGQAQKSAPPVADAAKAYSGMYTFQKEGEFVQITVEDDGKISGFISRYGDGESDKGEFLDQFFKSGKLDANKLSFTTDVVHGVAFDFKGTVERGEGKNPGDDGYFVLKGTLTQNNTDVDKRVTSQSKDVTFKMFPEAASPSAAARK